MGKKLPPIPAIKKDIAETALITYPRFNKAYEALNECYESYSTRAQPCCKALHGSWRYETQSGMELIPRPAKPPA